MSTSPTGVKGLDKLNEIAAEALSDENYRQQLINDPKAELQKKGLTVPDDLDVEIHENTDRKIHLVLPSRPGEQAKLDVNETHITHLVATTHF
jgi:hypothetical protein